MRGVDEKSLRSLDVFSSVASWTSDSEHGENTPPKNFEGMQMFDIVLEVAVSRRDIKPRSINSALPKWEQMALR